MAYSQNPAVATYSTKEIKIYEPLNGRNAAATKDVDHVNVFFEKGEDGYMAFKRAGLTSYLSLPSANVRGVYYWEDLNKVLVATDNDVSVYDSNSGVLQVTLSNIFGTTSGDVGFSEFLYDTNITKVVITDGTTLGTVDSAGVWAASADPDMPVPHLPDPVFLDGYLFLVKTGTADIYNSDLNDPLLYTPGNFISCEMFPDTVLKFAKLNNYLLAFGSASIEYFWDAANPTGSPLQRNDTPVKLVGYLGGFAQSANRIYFVGNTSTSTPDVYMLEDFKIDPVGDATVRRYLESLTTVLNSNIGNITSFMGHDFYVMNVSSLTYAYDLKEKQWNRWAYRQFGNFPLEQSISVKSNTTYSSAVHFNGEATILKFSPAVYQDNGTTFTSRVVTSNQTFGSYNQKSGARLIIKGDRPATDANLQVSWSDDDYQTYSVARAINLNQDIPCLWQLGRFRRRAFKLEFTENAPLRLEGMDIELNQGQS
jgi:hypothetical protein